MKRTMKYMMASLLAVGATARAQDKPAPATDTPLKLQVVMTRYDGDKKVSSLPYSLLVNAAEPNGKPIPKELKMGVQVPFAVMVRDAPTVAFKDAGSKIVCSATSLGGGRYRLQLEIEQAGVLDPSRQTADRAVSGPVLRQFRDSVDIIMRDGQTMQTSSAADPLTGEVLKIDVTLAVVK
jgi:hypothetical protein